MALDQRAPKGYQKAWNGGGAPETGLDRIAAERAKQVTRWSPAHDDGHVGGELAAAAAALAIDDADCVPDIDGTDFVADLMALVDADWITPLVREHRHDRVQQLAIAGALIASEIDRILRARGRSGRQ